MGTHELDCLYARNDNTQHVDKMFLKKKHVDKIVSLAEQIRLRILAIGDNGAAAPRR